MSPHDPSTDPTLHDVMDILHTMNSRMDTSDKRLGDIESNISAMKNEIEDIHETLNAVAKAVDKDSVTLIDHGRRIAKLEQARA